MGKQVRYTKEQESVINFRGNNILVSAAAGSGKTTVMIQRVCDLIEKDKVPISKFLIISFTKASASDMKNKLIKKLSSMKPTPFILEQLDDILTSDVSNLHSFCARLLKSYFYEVGLDPTFVVLDDIEVSVCKEKALTKLFNEKAEAGDKDFYELVDIFSKSRKDTGLKEAILKLYNFLGSITDSDVWFKTSLKMLYASDLSSNSGANIINSHMKAERKRMEEKINSMIDFCLSAGENKFVEYLQAVDSEVKKINFSDSYFNNAKRIAVSSRMPNIPKASEGREFIRENVYKLKEEIKERMDKLKEYACCDELEEVAHNLEITGRRVNNLYKLTKEFEDIFKSLKKEKGGLDFNDLEQYTLKVLENPTILKEIKNKYEYVFVDEYQDINGVQEKILTQVSRENNRFMVGDVKQSIYRFRLCDPEIFLQKYNLYKENGEVGKLICLNANFRSKSAILNFVNSIFDKAMTEDFGGVDYKKDSRLIVGDEERQKDDEKRVKLLFADTSSLNTKKEGEVELYSVMNDCDSGKSLEKQGEAEGIMIAAEIADLVANKKIIDADTGRKRNMKFSDITILTLSRNAFLNKITDVLESKGIPVSTDIEDNSLEDEYVQGIRSFLETVGCFKVDYSLFECMYSKVFGFSANELAKIKLASQSESFFYKSVTVASESGLLEEELQNKLNNFFMVLSEAREKASFLSVKELALWFVKKQKIKVKMSFENDYQKKLQKLSRFLTSLNNQTVFEYLNDTALADVKCEPVYAGNAVKVMTIHKSKGLEFNAVFVVGANRQFNMQSVNKDALLISKDHGVTIDFYERDIRYKTETLAKNAVKLIETRKLLEEQQRLLYVAFTRATDYLYVVGSGDYKNIKTSMPITPMCFLDFMGDYFVNPDNHKEDNYETVLLDAKDLISEDDEVEKRQVIIADFDQEGIDKFKNILNKEYKFKESINIPLKTAVTSIAMQNQEVPNISIMFSDNDNGNVSAEYGTLMHKVMEQLDLNIQDKNQIKSQIEKMQNDGILLKEEVDTINIDAIHKILNNPQFKSIINHAKVIYKEKEFYMLENAQKVNKFASEEDKIIVQGIIDLCIVKDDGLIIVDYKTGNINKNNIMKYKQQIQLYAQAMKKSMNFNVNSMYIASLKDGEIIKI